MSFWLRFCPRLAIIFCGAIVLTSCLDSIFLYQPQGWTAGPHRYEWQMSMDGIHLSTRGISATIGSGSVGPEFHLKNTGEHEVVLQGAELFVGEAISPLRSVAIPGDLGVLAPREEREIPLYWEFDRPAVDVLGPQPKIVLTLLMQDRALRVEVVYERVR